VLVHVAAEDAPMKESEQSGMGACTGAWVCRAFDGKVYQHTADEQRA